MYVAKVNVQFGDRHFAAGEPIVDVPEDRLRRSRFVKRVDGESLTDPQTDLPGDPPAQPDGSLPADIPGAQALAAIGVTTVKQLRELTSVDNWHEPIPGIGDKTAEAIETFLADQPANS